MRDRYGRLLYINDRWVIGLSFLLTGVIIALSLPANEKSENRLASDYLKFLSTIGDQTLDIDQLNNSLNKADSALGAAQAEINSFSLLGGASGIEQGVRDAVDQLVGAVDKVDTQLVSVRNRIDAHLATLDPNIPSHQRAIERANEMKTRIDDLRDRFKDSIHRIADALGRLINKVDDELNRMDAGNPLYWAASIYWSQLRFSLVDAQARLAAV